MADTSREWSSDIKDLGEKFVGLTVLKAQELVDYLKEEHGIEAASGGGAVMMAAPAASGEAAEEQTEFSVILVDPGAEKLKVIKEVKSATGLGLKEAKALVDEPGKAIKEGIDKASAEELKAKLEKVGAKVELK